MFQSFPSPQSVMNFMSVFFFMSYCQAHVVTVFISLCFLVYFKQSHVSMFSVFSFASPVASCSFVQVFHLPHYLFVYLGPLFPFVQCWVICLSRLMAIGFMSLQVSGFSCSCYGFLTSLFLHAPVQIYVHVHV